MGNPAYIDLDLFATVDPGTGRIKEAIDADAVQEALRFFINSKLGDMCGYPLEGGPLDEIPFKNFNSDTAQGIQFSLFDTFARDFTPAIDVRDITVTPDYDNKIFSITLTYVNPVSNQMNSITNFFKLNIPQNKTIEYVEVPWIGDENGMNFVITTKPSQPNEKLIFDALKGVFLWGHYSFVNLKATHPEFGTMLQYINLS